MKEPNPRSSRLALATGLAAAILVGGGGFMLGQRSGTPAQSPAPDPLPSVQPRVPTPAVASPRTLNRSDLIGLANTAADITARGDEASTAVSDLAGRRFSIALPFGCSGPAAEESNADMRWRYDEDAQALRLHVAPVAWATTDWWQRSPPSNIDGIEGFWIARPWITEDVCPRNASAVTVSGAEPVTLTGQTLAIGELFTSGDARQGRRDGKAYTAVIKMAPDAIASDKGFRVRLEGQLATVADKSVVRCRQPGGAEQQPVCLIGARIDDVIIENGTTGAELARWSVATRSN